MQNWKFSDEAVLHHVVDEVVAEAKVELARVGVFLGEVEELEAAPLVYDCVEVEEISWSRRHGPYIRLDVSMEVEGLLQKYGLADMDVREMEESLEEILDYEAHRILRKFNRALQEVMSEDLRNCHARGKIVPLCK